MDLLILANELDEGANELRLFVIKNCKHKHMSKIGGPYETNWPETMVENWTCPICHGDCNKLIHSDGKVEFHWKITY